MNNSFINENNRDKQLVGKITWPFYRYKVLIPEQVKGDLFVWLYLSLIVYKNEENKLDKNAYFETTKNDVIKILKDKFSSIIDLQTIEKIIYNAEKDYLEDNDNGKQLKNDVFSFLDTYEELFSDKVDIQFIYQDGITGDVLPFFGELENILSKDNPNISESIQINKSVKKPTKMKVKEAYKQYISLKKYNAIPEEYFEEEEIDNGNPFDKIVDEDKQEFFDTLDDEIMDDLEEKKEKKINFKSYNVVYLDDTQVIYNLDVPIYIYNNTLVASSPFNDLTDYWINNCLKKARNINADIDSRCKEFEKIFISEAKEENKFSFNSSNKYDIADSLKNCGPLYRLINSLNNNDLKDFVMHIDNYYEMQDERFYDAIGKYLECFIFDLKDSSDLNQRKNRTLDIFCREIETKCLGISLDYSRLTYSDVYEHWVKGWHHFKAEIANIILKTDLVKSPNMYYDFINDLFYLYDLRNDTSHYKKGVFVRPKKEDIDLLLKVSKVLIELY